MKQDGDIDGSSIGAPEPPVPQRRTSNNAGYPGERVEWLEAALSIMVRHSIDGRRCIYMDSAWRDFTGHYGGAGDLDIWASAVHPDDLEDCLELLAGAFEAQDTLSFFYRARRFDGTFRWLQERVAPLKDEKGALEGLYHTAIDVTEIRADYETMEQKIEQERLLHREHRHRTRNHLQLIQSLLRSHYQKMSDPADRQVFAEVMHKVEAVAEIERQIELDGCESTVRLDSYLRGVAAPIEEMLIARGITVQVDLAPVRVPVGYAAPLGSLVNETLTNALKHAFPDGRAGTVRLVSMVGEGVIALVVADDGVGLPDTPSTAMESISGIGLIGGLVDQMGGDLTIERRPGTSYVVRFPLTQTGSTAARADLD